MKYRHFFQSGLSVFGDVLNKKNSDRLLNAFLVAASVGVLGAIFEVDRKIDDFAHQKFERTVFKDLGQYRFEELRKDVRQSFGNTALADLTDATMQELDTQEYKKLLKERGTYSFYELEKEALGDFKKDAEIESVEAAIGPNEADVEFEPELPKEKIRIVLDESAARKSTPAVEVQPHKAKVVKSIQDIRANFLKAKDLYSVFKPK